MTRESSTRTGIFARPYGRAAVKRGLDPQAREGRWRSDCGFS
jgi:hypothetical protein